LSHYLIIFYFDELSVQLSTTREGCTVGNAVVNHLLFGDHMCIWTQLQLSPMPSEYLFLTIKTQPM